MLSSLKPSAGKFVLGPPVDSTPPVVVFTGPADHPDPVQVAHAPKHTKKKTAAQPDKTDKKTVTKSAKTTGKARRHGKAKAKVSSAK